MQVRNRLSRMTRGCVVLIALAVTSVASAQPSVTITPLQSIQGHINSGLYNEIILSPGTYFQLVNMNGAAITLRSTDPLDPAVVASTIIDGQFLSDSVIKCITGEGPDTIIDGLTIINGEAFNIGTGSDRGGGLYINLASPTVRNCVFDSNESTGAGGGLYANSSGSTITNCSFLGNDAENGGGIYLNASASMQVIGCTFDGNISNDDGGGARCIGGSVSFTGCTFANNTSTAEGGGIHSSGATLTVDRTEFMNNVSGTAGGGVMTQSTGSSVYRNSVFIGNNANFGGGIYASNPTDVVNCSFTLNSANTAGGALQADIGANPDLVSSILWDNSPNPLTGGATYQVTYSLISGGYVGVGNFDADPLFADAIGGDLSLLPGSPAIDAGDASAVTGEYPVDMLSQVRAVDDPDSPDTGLSVLGLAVDMGAFELQAVPIPVCQGDVDGSGMVNVTDLLALLAGWGSCP